VLLGDSSKDQAASAVEKFKNVINEYNVNSRNEYEVSFSYGIVNFDPRKHDSLEAMMRDCDAVMYANKKLKNKVVNIGEIQKDHAS